MANAYKIVADGGMRIPLLASDPSSPDNGTMWYNTTDNLFKSRENGSTQSLGSTTTFSDAVFRIQDDGDATKQIAFQASGITTATTRTITMPDADVDLGTLVVGPASATDNAIARFDATTGKLIQNSGVTIDDTNNMAGVANITTSGDIDKATAATLSIGATNATTINLGRTGQTVVVVGNLQIDGDTVTANTATLDVEDVNITVNNGGNQATANGTAGLTVEMSDATDVTLLYDSTLASRWKAGDAAAEIELANVSSTQTFTNKSINADSNTITNIDNADIKAGAAIDATKIHDGSVDNTEFGYLNGVTSAIQTQLDGKASTALSNLASVAINTSLVSDTNNTDDLGSAAINWKDVHAKTLQSSTTLDLSANSGAGAMTAVADTLSRGKSGAALVEEEYLDSTSLTDNTTAVIAALTFATASYNAIEVEYLIREATSLETQVGKLLVTTDGTSTSITDTNTSVGDPGVTFSAAVSTGNVEISYTTTSTGNARTMRADVKRFRAI